MTRLGSVVSVCAIYGLVGALPAHAQPACIGDCSGDGVVSINEIITCVNIDLGSAALTTCPACSSNGTSVGITDLVTAVNNALDGCPGGGPTATPTITGGMSPTPTATVSSGTVRTFSVDTLLPKFTTADVAGSGLFNDNLLGGGNVAASMSSGPFVLVLGTPDAKGVAPLTLQSDVTISVDIQLNVSCVCLKFSAQGSSGSISCNGGTAYDTTVTQNTDSLSDTAWTIQTGQGSAAGPGNGDLILTALFQDFPGTCATVNCDTQTYKDPPNQFPFTTTQSTTVKKDAGTFTTSAGAGGAFAPFDCANFGTAKSGGTFVSGIAFTDPVGGATADHLRFAE